MFLINLLSIDNVVNIDLSDLYVITYIIFMIIYVGNIIIFILGMRKLRYIEFYS